MINPAFVAMFAVILSIIAIVMAFRFGKIFFKILVVLLLLFLILLGVVGAVVYNDFVNFKKGIENSKNLILLKSDEKIIAGVEEEFFPDDAIEAIIKASEGCPRQALVMVEQIKGLNPKQMKESVEKFASYESSIIDLCRAMTKRQNWKGISTILQGLDAEPETIRRSILGYFNKVLLSSGSPVHASIMDVFSKHTYDSGRAGLTLMCFMSTFIDKK